MALINDDIALIALIAYTHTHTHTVERDTNSIYLSAGEIRAHRTIKKIHTYIYRL